jgi:hypothetical protein
VSKRRILDGCKGRPRLTLRGIAGVLRGGIVSVYIISLLLSIKDFMLEFCETTVRHASSPAFEYQLYIIRAPEERLWRSTAS